MLIVIKSWFRRYFSDPEAVFLFFLLLTILFAFMFFGKMMAPVVVSIMIAYLLEWPVQQLRRRLKFPRLLAVSIVFTGFLALLAYAIFGLLPLLSEQISNLVSQWPTLVSRGQALLLQLPDRYPGYISSDQLQNFIVQFKTGLLKFGQVVLSHSLSSISNLIMLMVYLVLVPLLVFFFLKDQQAILAWVGRVLPKDRGVMQRIWQDIHRQLGNYIRGKVIEIVIVGIVSYVAFLFLGLQYAALLGVLVGVSVLVPFIGAVVVTIPVLLIGFVDWGWGPHFIYLSLIYTIIITLDANVLVPVLFSEAVNLHPIAIIIAILGFGGLWGFWGVFFAIPLASVVKAIITAWPVQQAEKI